MWWWAAAALAGEHGAGKLGTVGLGPGMAATERSAALDVAGQLVLWANYAPRPWGLALDLGAWRHTTGEQPYEEGESLYQLRIVQTRAALLAELATGTQGITFHAGLGPALSWSATRVRWAGRDVRVTALEPGLAGRLALDGPLGPVLAWQWRVGVTARGLQAVDYDTALGLGVQW
jgi:hypothetical protein